MRPTRRGYAVLIAATVLLASGWWLRYPLPALIGAAGLAAVSVALLTVRRGPPVAVTRTISPARVERGRPATAVLTVRPTGTEVEIRDVVAGQVHLVRTAATAEYPLPTGVRGRYPVGPLEIGREDPLGLARSRHRTGSATTLVVYPRQLPARAGGGPSRRTPPGPATDDLRRGSAEPRGIREYEPGDEVRRIHWRATAHTGRLMVRDLGDPRQARLTVLLDTRAGVLGADDFEEAVDLAASLLGAAARAGVPTRLVTADGRELAGPFLEVLAAVRPDGTGPLTAHGGGRLALITGEPGAPAALGRAFDSLVVLALGPGVGAEQALRVWNEAHR
ncbi:DUF58 domain-containing protein [Paractinoplanes hotanensis]|uniref:DUF58 domain-containing protein n=1 Tax=Paractinoplanes hotanensis TaxID=2906497 RepID=A0ABT0Y510_9ACTN|nr:DUF58 domain-containing protein [Actinoplanes hotanensis]MCM4081116.1 DUF58 domain-containing protein [Actinoplanes hotanensis]